MITRYDSNNLILRGAGQNLKEVIDKYKSSEGSLINGTIFLRFPEQESARAQMSAAYLYYDQMDEGRKAPDSGEVRMFLDWVWDVEAKPNTNKVLELIARELDRNFGVDLWWTFEPTLRFEL